MIIRWVSEDGKRRWIYPVKEDLYNKGRIIKKVSHEAKIIGITMVNIPSPLHPIVPYYVMLLEDEYGNRLPKKTMKKRKIGEMFKIKKAATEGAVIITKIKYDIKEYLNEALNLLHAFELNPEDKLLIKPSIIEPAYPYQAVNTNPNVIDALIAILKEIGIGDIVVAEQAMPGNNTVDSAKKSGIIEVCKKHNVQFIDLSRSEFIEKKFENVSFKIAKEVLERKVINVPVMKTNSQIVISGALENMVRVVDTETQKRMYDQDIEMVLPKLIKALPPFLSIGDATIGMHGEGPTTLGEPAFLNIVFISKDPVALDAIFAESGMLAMPHYLTEAASLNAGNNNTGSIEVVGDELEAIKFYLQPAEKNLSRHPNIELIDGKADPYLFNSALKLTSKLFGILGHRIQLVIGANLTKEMAMGKVRMVVYGDSTIERARELGFDSIAEISEDIDDMEKLSLLKRILEDPEKSKITASDRIISKIAKFGAKLKGSIG